MDKAVIDSLFVRKNFKQPMVPVNKILLIEGLGIDGDVHQSLLSPRQVLLVSRKTIARFNLQAGQLNENITTEGLDVDSLESGNLIKIGSVILRISVANERCNVVQSQIKKNRGVYATVIAGGEIQQGDTISVISKESRLLSSKRFDLFLYFLKQVPKGKVVTYNEIVTAIGGKKVHFRIIPTFIKRAALISDTIPLHRLLDSRGQLLNSYIPNQQSLLIKENVVVVDNKVHIENFLWNPKTCIYN